VTAGAFGDTFHWTNNDTITHTTTQNGPLSLWNSGHLNGGERGHDVHRRRRLRGRPEWDRVRHPVEEGKRRVDGVEERDHVEVRDVQAEGIGNVVVPIASA